MTDAIVPSVRPSFDGRMDTMTQAIRIHELNADGCLGRRRRPSAIGHRIGLAKGGSQRERQTVGVRLKRDTAAGHYVPPKNDGSRMSRIVRSPGAAVSTAGIEFTVIDEVAMSPCTPPAIFE